MASKRDQLKRLKEGRKKEPIQEMSSPVDDTLKKLDDNGEPAVEERVDHENGVDIVKMQEETVVEDIKEAKAEPVNEPEDEPVEKVADKPEDELVSEPVNGQEEVKKQPVTEKKKEATKRTSMALLVENNKYIRLRSIQLGMSIQEYVNLLIDEEIEREKNGEMADLNDIENNLDMNYRRGQNSAIVALVLKESNARFLKRGGAMHGMNATAFFNHIVSEERRREEEHGPRQGEYDAF